MYIAHSISSKLKSSQLAFSCLTEIYIIKNVTDFKNLKPHRNLNIFHEASMQTSPKTENKLKVKVCPKSMYITQKVSEVTIPITNNKYI